MRTRHTSLWLLTSILALIIVLPVLPGQAAGDPALVAAAKNDDLPAVRALLAKRVERQRAGARRIDRAAVVRLQLQP